MNSIDWEEEAKELILQNDILNKRNESLIAEIERLEKEYQEIRYYHMEKLKDKNKKLQRALVKLIDCIEEPEINQDYEIELAIKEARQALGESKC